MSFAFRVEGVLNHGTTRYLFMVDETWLHMILDNVYTRLNIIVSSILSSYYYYLEAKCINDILLVFDKSYHDNTNNENSSQSIIVFNIHPMLRDIDFGIR